MVQWWHRDGPQSLARPLGTDSPSDVRATYPIETELIETELKNRPAEDMLREAVADLFQKYGRPRL